MRALMRLSGRLTGGTAPVPDEVKFARSKRLAVYTDYPYYLNGDRVYAERSFAAFLARLGSHFERFAVIGRLAPASDRGRYELGENVDLVPLPYYPRLSDPGPALRGMAGSFRTYWTALRDIDCVWLLGPHPLVFPFAAMALLRKKQVVLGVREDLPEYVRMRHPNRRRLQYAARAMTWGFRTLGRVCGVVAVGPAIADQYRHSRRLLQITVSLVDDVDIVSPESQGRDDDQLTVLSVGRLEAEKNPLMLADVLSRLVDRDPRWRLIVCGEGTLFHELDDRFRELGLAASVELRGYVPLDGGLTSLYRECQMLLHVSWTEGLPQVLYEAFAAALPVVATDVGGIAIATGDAVTLVPPGDPEAAAQALIALSEDESLRRSRILAGNALIRRATIQDECARVARFIAGETLDP
jgi:glycosyltransferase involved in cell wall biosynthesis